METPWVLPENKWENPRQPTTGAVIGTQFAAQDSWLRLLRHKGPSGENLKAEGGSIM